MIILDLSHPIIWLVRHVCSDKTQFFFFAKENRFLMLFQMCTKLMFGLSAWTWKGQTFALSWFKFSRRFQGNLETSVYCKPTHMGKYHTFDSHHPIFYKKSVTKTFLRRAGCLPSLLDLKAEERKYVSNVFKLKANGYTKLIPSQGSPIVSWIKTLKTGF